MPSPFIAVAGQSGELLNDSDFVITRPAVSENEVMICMIAARKGAGGGTYSWSSIPAGWTEFEADASDSNSRHGYFWKLAGDSEPATYTFTISDGGASNHTFAALIAVYGSVATSSTIDASDVASNVSSPTVTTTLIQTTVVAGTCSTDPSPPATMDTEPSGYTLRKNQNNNGTNGQVLVAIADKVYNAAGATGSASWTFTGGQNPFGLHAALLPLGIDQGGKVLILF